MKSLFDKMNVGKKFIFTFIVIFIVFAMVLGTLLILSFQASRHNQGFYDTPYKSIEAQLKIRNELNKINGSIMKIALAEDAATISTSAKSIIASGEVVKEQILIIKKVAGDTTLIDEFADDFNKASTAMSSLQELALKGDAEKTFDTYISDCVPKIEVLNQKIDKIGEATTTIGSDYINKYSSIKANAQIYYAVLSVFAFVLIAYTMFSLNSSIVPPIKKLVVACNELRDGKQIKALDITSKDEFGELAHSFEEMSHNISFVIDDTCLMLSKGASKDLTARSENEDKYVGKYSELVKSTYAVFSDMSKGMQLTNDIAEQVSSGSNQISAVAQILAQGTTEQASAVEELSVTVSNIAELSKMNAEHANLASSMSIEAASGVDESNKYMAQMLQAMNEITATSKEIGKIVKAIDDIAFQTNILSLNAAVEAARAGASGKGFAVVADEVRNLAQRSAEAAKNTTALVESTVIAIEHGTKIADATAKSLHTVEEKSSFVSGAIVKIAEASENQATATEQVLQGISQVSTVVQTNSATAEESAAAAEELAALSKQLSELTGQYKLLRQD